MLWQLDELGGMRMGFLDRIREIGIPQGPIAT